MLVADGTWFRDDVMRRYDFTLRAREILSVVPVTIDNEREPVGGGLWYPFEQRIHLNGIQDEACIHELTHAWADLTQFYVDPHPHDPALKGQHFAFREDVDRAALEQDEAYRRVAFLAWEYTYGNPRTGFEGMKEIDWERFAGLASGVMADTRLMPPYLRRWYDDLFAGHPEVAGPAEIPGWAPRDWSPGTPRRHGVHSAGAPPVNDSLVARVRRWLFGDSVV